MHLINAPLLIPKSRYRESIHLAIPASINRGCFIVSNPKISTVLNSGGSLFLLESHGESKDLELIIPCISPINFNYEYVDG